jgi:Flp pilus assembly protein TadD
MTSSKMTLRPQGLCLLASGLLLSPAVAGAQAQTTPGTYTYQLGPVSREDPSTALARYVRDLSTNPQSLVALKGAGAAALKLGDADAAGGFYARAEDVSPRDGEVKAGLAATLALMGQPDDALRLFGEAAALGVPDRDLAAYRGLAYDLKGDQVSAQRDYALAIRTHDDVPEVERRLALSQAITGNKTQALATIEAQLRHQNKAAWRTRAFVLALTGDLAGATQAVKVAIPAQADAFAPFLARLASLTPAEKAAAVNLGQMPVTFQNLRTAEQVLQPAASSAQMPASTFGASIPARTAPAATAPIQVARAPVVASQPVQPPAGTALTALAPPSASAAPPSQQAAALVPQQKPVLFADVAALVRDLPSASTQAQPAPGEPARSKAEAPAPAVAKAKVEPKAAKAETKTARAEPKTDAKAAKGAAAKKPESKKKDPAKEHPARSWVQLASGSNAAALPGEYKKAQGKASKLLAGKSAWTMKQGATNRLLVGPFKTAKEAQTFVNDLAKNKVNGFAWTSAAGQEIQKLGAK